MNRRGELCLPARPPSSSSSQARDIRRLRHAGRQPSPRVRLLGLSAQPHSKGGCLPAPTRGETAAESTDPSGYVKIKGWPNASPPTVRSTPRNEITAKALPALIWHRAPKHCLPVKAERKRKEKRLSQTRALHTGRIFTLTVFRPRISEKKNKTKKDRDQRRRHITKRRQCNVALNVQRSKRVSAAVR